MASYNIQADSVSKHTPKLTRGEIKITAAVAVYYRIGSDGPTATNKCAFIPAGKTIQVRLPTNCLQVAVLAVNSPGSVTVAEVSKAKSSCA
jgi:hypothetical protein